MKVGNENKKKLYLAGILGFFAIFALFYLYNELFGGPTNPPNAQAPVIVQGPAVRTSGLNATGATGGGATSTGAAGKAVTSPPGFVVGGAKQAQRVGAGGAALDPTLHREAMLVTESLVYSGSGRNIFAGEAEAPKLVAVVKPIAPVRPVAPVYTPPPAPTGPPPPPPINLKFFGTATAANGVRQAFLLSGDDVFLASAGDVVNRRYRVVTIAASSIVVEDIPNSNRQTLPLQVN